VTEALARGLASEWQFPARIRLAHAGGVRLPFSARH